LLIAPRAAYNEQPPYFIYSVPSPSIFHPPAIA
jgi:hypothetical protein